MMDSKKVQAELKYNKYAHLLCTTLRIVLDYIIVVLVVFLCEKLRDVFLAVHYAVPLSRPDTYRFVILPLCYMTFANMYGLYTKRQQFADEILCVLKASCLGTLAATLVLYLTQDAASTSRLFITFFALLIFPCISVGRLILKNIVKNNRFLATPALILLGGDVDMKVVEEIHHTISVGYNYIGYLSYNIVQQSQIEEEKIPHLGIWEDAPNIIKKHGIDDVFIIAHKLPLAGIEQLVATLQPLVKHLSIVPTLGRLPLNSVDLTIMLDGRYVMLNLHNNLKIWYNRLGKFIFDYMITILLTILVAPILLIIAIAIKLDSKGPVFFVQDRIGRGGKHFNCYKFRSMWQDAEKRLSQILADDPALQQEWNTFHKMKNDPRITRVGKFLRATSLDELPQLFNVLKGDMSLVGPRPCCESEVIDYGDLIEDYYIVRPAITGLWQTSGRNSLDFSDRVYLDTWYAKNWTPWLDIVIIWKTIKVVLKKGGAY
ncbi:MAG: undecaprenyl-phosphate galactose phosphotransferase WbaP [Synergistaceae bacterium]|nr:undecaprenyl-phosphate galactose phosphotransferase WbaP [Synergistaceae bacterium]